MKKFTTLAFMAVLMVVILSVSGAHAFDREHWLKFVLTHSCPGCDLSYVDIRWQEHVGANLQGANLTGAQLTETNLEKANLSGANLSLAIMRKTKLNNANLQGANLTSAIAQEAWFMNANLKGANLTNTHLEAAILIGAIWTDGATCKDHSIDKCVK